MRNLNIPDDVISQLRLESLRLDSSSTVEVRNIIPKFDTRALPLDAISFEELTTFLKLPDGDYAVPTKFTEAYAYLVERKIDPWSYPFYWANKTGFNNRLIIPFLYKGEIVGWTARAINDAKPKYLSEQQPGYVFNLDSQQDDRQLVIVCEGPFDALSIDGIAIMHDDISNEQAQLIASLNKQIIVVPDRDKAGLKICDRALELGYQVSLPEWDNDVKDVNDAVICMGRLGALLTIMQARETSKIKIEIRKKQLVKRIRTS